MKIFSGKLRTYFTEDKNHFAEFFNDVTSLKVKTRIRMYFATTPSTYTSEPHGFVVIY